MVGVSTGKRECLDHDGIMSTVQHLLEVLGDEQMEESSSVGG